MRLIHAALFTGVALAAVVVAVARGGAGPPPALGGSRAEAGPERDWPVSVVTSAAAQGPANLPAGT